MTTYYSWSRFMLEIDNESSNPGRVRKWINPGDEITQEDIKVNDAEWDVLIHEGVVREQPYPNLAKFGHTGSPSEFHRTLIAKLGDGNPLTRDELDALGASSPMVLEQHQRAATVAEVVDTNDADADADADSGIVEELNPDTGQVVPAPPSTPPPSTPPPLNQQQS